MQRYNPKELEPKWQKVWQESKIYQASDDATKTKRYVLEFFPYPSGAAMHVGHVRNYTIGDVIARFYRMKGFNVLHPMGWDAFGLPAENYAIKNNISPKQAIAENTVKFKKQLIQMGFSYDWSREINSSDPEYYRWTQWFFKLLFERGLAYQKESQQWWCETDKTVLANEQVEAGKCWRCGNTVTKKLLKQWFFKITDYADRLADDLEDLDWSDSIKSMQKNWIGKSKGVEIDFVVEGRGETLKVFTTRADTLFGATFLVVAPEQASVDKITTPQCKAAVQAYVRATQSKSDVERQETDREKTGVFTGSYAVNPINGQKIPIWVADYVLAGYGTGAIMAVPAHDDRDYAFAKKFDIAIKEVVVNKSNSLLVAGECYHGEGQLINSGKYDGLASSAAREIIIVDLAQESIAKEVVNYKIRDWLISRQRYWGAPIPIVHCPIDGAVAVPDSQLPLELPEVDSYQPNGQGTSVLAGVESWVNTVCPKCGGPARRETDTMDGFACSSWYFLRFADPRNNQQPFAATKAKFWLPVDDYIGGAEHAVMHLLYARMWTKVMYDAGLIDFEEPFKALHNHGMILAPDGRKMSKSWGNVIAPDDIINQGYGADAIRIMELFIGPWNQAASWSVEGMGGCYRFLQRIWTLVQEYQSQDQSRFEDDDQTELRYLTHKTIKKVTDDLARMGYNTAIATLMEFVNDLYKIKLVVPASPSNLAWKEAIQALLQLVAPMAPHIAEELWQQIGAAESIHTSLWPEWNDAYLVRSTKQIVVQINGKLRSTITVASDVGADDVKLAAQADQKIKQLLAEVQIKKIIYVEDRLVNIVI